MGDALGRQQDWSDNDKKFAVNCGMKYYSPEKIFPHIINNYKDVNFTHSNNQEIILMMGYPGSGKTKFTNKYFNNYDNYIVLHGDDIKTEKKMKTNLTKQIENGRSVVIDATNPSIKKRIVFVEIAQKYNIPIRLIHVSTSIELSMERNFKRDKDKQVPKIAFYTYRKKFEEPNINEGFKEIIIV